MFICHYKNRQITHMNMNALFSLFLCLRLEYFFIIASFTCCLIMVYKHESQEKCTLIKMHYCTDFDHLTYTIYVIPIQTVLN